MQSGGSCGILALSAVGYRANAENLSKAVLTRMDQVINFGPAIFYIVAAVMFLCIRMTKEKARLNEAKIEELMKKTA